MLLIHHVGKAVDSLTASVLNAVQCSCSLIYCHVRFLWYKLTSQAMADMQGTYQYWGAQLFSYFDATVASTYVFQMQVDSAARLWVQGTLVIDATCMALAQHLNSMCSADCHQTSGHII